MTQEKDARIRLIEKIFEEMNFPAYGVRHAYTWPLPWDPAFGWIIHEKGSKRKKVVSLNGFTTIKTHGKHLPVWVWILAEKISGAFPNDMVYINGKLYKPKKVI